MRRRLPNLNAVRAFDAAARHHSFSRAAEELGVTHASVSRYVKALEEQLGEPLFERRHRQVALTAAGARYSEIVAEALMLISLETGTRVTRDAREKAVVEIDSDLASLWLMPLLDRDELEALDLDLELRSYSTPPRTIAPDADLALTWGAMDVPGFSRELFLNFTSFPVCAPQEAARVVREGLSAQTLIVDRGLNTWEEILKQHGGNIERVKSFLTVHRTYLALDAAERGLGVAIGDDVTAAAKLRAGTLVRPFGPSIAGRRSFYISTVARKPVGPGVEALRVWLIARAGEHMEWTQKNGYTYSGVTTG